MTTRILPREEWGRLADAEIDPPEHGGDVIVVEQDGAIVACAGLAWCLHVEDVWVRPAHRGKVGAVRALLRGVMKSAAPTGIRAVCVGVVDLVIADFVARLGGLSLGEHFALPLERFQ